MKNYTILNFNYKTTRKEDIFPTEESQTIYNELKKMSEHNTVFKDNPTECKNGKTYEYSIFAPWISGADWKEDKEGYSILPLDIYIRGTETEGSFIIRILEKNNHNYFDVSFRYVEMDKETFKEYCNDSYKPESVNADKYEGLELVRNTLLKFYNLHSDIWEQKHIKNTLIKQVNKIIY